MITIVDYGLGNIRAFVNIYERLNIKVRIAKSKADFHDVEKIIIPGVGAFDYAMSQLNNSGMRDVLEEEVILKGKPVLGVCVGMQMLADSSDEGSLKGLGWIEGNVQKFDRDNFGLMTYTLPHMGWNNVEQDGKCSLFNGISDQGRFYFLHSFYFNCKSNDDVAATTTYGAKFTSAINRSNIFGVQFHPEKSHGLGIQLLSNFAHL